MSRQAPTWFTAVTTAPRKDCTLLQCLSSLEEAGFSPHVFAEPGSTRTFYPTIWNEKKRGLWHNWIYSARYALRCTKAEVILTVQDDALLHPESKEYIERCLWPSEKTGLISLYTPKHYGFDKHGYPKPKGLNLIQEPVLWGAVALVWPREVLERLLSTRTVKNWIGVPPSRGTPETLEERLADPTLVKNSDAAMGLALQELRRETYYVKPSLVTHISRHSTVGNGANVGNRNCWNPARHEESLNDLPTGPATDLSFPESPELGSFNITEDHLDEILKLVPPGGKILELGSGAGTQKLVDLGYQVVSIEEDVSWMGKARGATYIHAPINRGWYDYDSIIRTKRIWEDYDLLLVDGPKGEGNRKIPSWLITTAPIIVDDTHRMAERLLAASLHETHNIRTKVCKKHRKWFAILESKEGHLPRAYRKEVS